MIQEKANSTISETRQVTTRVKADSVNIESPKQAEPICRKAVDVFAEDRQKKQNFLTIMHRIEPALVG